MSVTTNARFYLIIDGERKFVLHDGHNLVGRSRIAKIIIRDINVSQQHALITIISPDSMYISDMGSSNGTFLRNESCKLKPWSLFRLQHDDVIKFGTVKATIQFASMGIDYSQTFQSSIVDDGVLDQATQVVHTGSLRETMSPIRKLPTINEVVLEQEIAKETIFNSTGTDKETGKGSETTYNAIEHGSEDESGIQKSSDNVNMSEDDLTAGVKKSTNCVDSDSDTDMVDHIYDKNGYDDAESVRVANNSAIKLAAFARVVDDSDTDIESDCDKIKFSTKKKTCISKSIQSDSETDIDTDLEDDNNMTEHQKLSMRTTVVDLQTALETLQCSTSFDFEEHSINVYRTATGNVSTADEVTEIPATQYSYTEQSLRNNNDSIILNSVQIENFLTANVSGTDIFLKPTQPVSNVGESMFLQPIQKLNDNQASDEDHIFLQPTQIISPDAHVVEEESVDASIFLQPTQKVDLNQKCDEDLLFMQPTQKLKDILDSKENAILHPTEITTGSLDIRAVNRETLNDSIFLQPTQKLTVNQECDEDLIFMQPTQKLNDKQDSDKDAKFMEPTQITADNSDVLVVNRETVNDSIFLQPTQKLTLDQECDEDFLFMQPTQILEESGSRTVVDIARNDSIPDSDRQSIDIESCEQDESVNVRYSDIIPATQYFANSNCKDGSMLQKSFKGHEIGTSIQTLTKNTTKISTACTTIKGVHCTNDSTDENFTVIANKRNEDGLVSETNGHKDSAECPVGIDENIFIQPTQKLNFDDGNMDQNMACSIEILVESADEFPNPILEDDDSFYVGSAHMITSQRLETINDAVPEKQTENEVELFLHSTLVKRNEDKIDNSEKSFNNELEEASIPLSSKAVESRKACEPIISELAEYDLVVESEVPAVDKPNVSNSYSGHESSSILSTTRISKIIDSVDKELSSVTKILQASSTESQLQESLSNHEGIFKTPTGMCTKRKSVSFTDQGKTNLVHVCSDDDISMNVKAGQTRKVRSVESQLMEMFTSQSDEDVPLRKTRSIRNDEKKSKILDPNVALEGQSRPKEKTRAGQSKKSKIANQTAVEIKTEFSPRRTRSRSTSSSKTGDDQSVPVKTNSQEKPYRISRNTDPDDQVSKKSVIEISSRKRLLKPNESKDPLPKKKKLALPKIKDPSQLDVMNNASQSDSSSFDCSKYMPQPVANSTRMETIDEDDTGDECKFSSSKRRHVVVLLTNVVPSTGDENNKIKEEASEKIIKKRGSEMTTPTLLCSPDRTKRQTKPKVVFTMMSSPEAESTIRSLGGKVVDSVEDCTVLVSSCVKRSEKLLIAIGLGKPVCSKKWIDESKKLHTFLDPWDFIYRDEEAESKWHFNLEESINRAVKTKMFENYVMIVLEDKAKNDILKSAIEACGGKCMSKFPTKTDKNTIVISSQPHYAKYKKYLNKSNILVVDAEAILEAALRQELRIENYLLK